MSDEIDYELQITKFDHTNWIFDLNEIIEIGIKLFSNKLNKLGYPEAIFNSINIRTNKYNDIALEFIFITDNYKKLFVCYFNMNNDRLFNDRIIITIED